MKKLFIVAIVLLSVFSTVFAAGSTESSGTSSNYPSRPITFIVNRAAGGATDAVARVIATAMQKNLGYTTVVQNLEGGDGLIGANTAITSNPDGYTFMIVGSTEIPNMLVNFPEASFTKEDLVPICEITSKSKILAVKPNSQIKTLDDFIAYAKANPGKLTVSVSGSNHFYGVILLEEALGIDLTIVNAGSGSSAYTMLLGGHVECGLLDSNYYENCELEGMAILADTTDNSAVVPDGYSTFTELGYDMVDTNFNYILAPKGTPAEICQFISDAVAKLNDEYDLKTALEATGQNAVYVGYDEFPAEYFEYIDKMVDLYNQTNSLV